MDSKELKYVLSLETRENVCRICFFNEGNTSIFAIAELGDLEVKVDEILETYTNIKAEEGDNLPKFICEGCLIQLLKTHEFLIKCKNSCEILNYLKEETIVNQCYVMEQQPNEEIERENVVIKTEIKEETPKDDPDERIQCTVCFKPYTKHVLKRHMLIHLAVKPYKCNICDAGFSACGNLMRHQRMHTGEKPYRCNICHKAFTRSNYLHDHQNMHKGIKPYCCDICAARFVRLTELKKHLLSHNPSTANESIKCPQCDKVLLSKSSYTAHMLTHGEKKFLCNICGRRYAIQANFLLHYKRHTAERPFRCEICSKGFLNAHNLAKHILVHTGEKPHQCNICFKAFTQVSNLKRHLMYHQGIKRHKCTFCGKLFAEKCNLVVHTRIHTGETPYHCKICNKGFYDSNTVKRHEIMHAKREPECNVEVEVE